MSFTHIHEVNMKKFSTAIVTFSPLINARDYSNAIISG